MMVNGPKSFLATNGGDRQVLPCPRENGEFQLKVRTKCIYIGKVKNISANIEIRNDRIVFLNINNGCSGSKFNITVPFIEIIALRYCFSSDISIFVIQPIYDSYQKLSNWIKSTALNRVIPENFIMVHFDTNLAQSTLENMRHGATQYNENIKIIEINSIFAESYLNMPNRMNNGRASRSTVSSTARVEEIIHLEDDDDDHDPKKSEMLHQIILKYPDNEPNSIILYGSDLNCIRDGQYLNDNIMNFYLKYYQYNGANLDRSILERIFVYDTLFATRLLNNPRKRRFHADMKGYLIFTQESFNNIYQKQLKKWTKDIDIFSKDYLIIPLIKDAHWFLAILCNIGNLIPDQSNGNSDDTISKERPTIICMDSLNTHTHRKEVFQTICKYLEAEYKEKRHTTGSLDTILLREYYPKVPQQQNFYDCGLFVLEYIERFLSNPEKVLQSIQKDSVSLANWFEPASLNTKRAKIKQIILNFLPPTDAVALERELDEKAEADEKKVSSSLGSSNDFFMHH